MKFGKKECFIELLDSNKRIIYKILNSFCRNQVDRKDLEQEITIQLWNSFDKYDSRNKYSTWMYRIALNVAISFYRKQKSWQSRYTSFPEESIFTIEDEDKYNSELDENLKILHQFINQLDELHKALMLLYLDEKKHEEIADILGISKTNVATKISRLKIKLSKEFQKLQSNGSD
ncbi:MAG: sigma-70 family RNA polymerase sigma factor [Bacteroidales bacterium]|nr:sigma-70 family RNA polymerase sigma factor [Bacteroidales bacterium]